jgi:hypothetical protein
LNKTANLKSSFEDVADWCERHLETQHGREIGLTFGAMIRAYGRLATLPSTLRGEERAARIRQLNAEAEELMLGLPKRLPAAYQWDEPKRRLAQLSQVRTNMIYNSRYSTE